LEAGDGAIVQLILAGKPDVKVPAAAVIEGQRGIREIAFPRARIPPTPLLMVLALAALLAGALLYALISQRRHAARRKAQFEKYLDPVPDELLESVSILYAPRRQKIIGYTVTLILMGGCLGLAGFTLYILLSQRLPTLPLDF
jgi:hypothetical protein